MNFSRNYACNVSTSDIITHGIAPMPKAKDPLNI